MNSAHLAKWAIKRPKQTELKQYFMYRRTNKLVFFLQIATSTIFSLPQTDTFDGHKMVFVYFLSRLEIRQEQHFDKMKKIAIFQNETKWLQFNNS